VRLVHEFSVVSAADAGIIEQDVELTEFVDSGLCNHRRRIVIGNILLKRRDGIIISVGVVLDAFPVTESANGVKIQRAKLRA